MPTPFDPRTLMPLQEAAGLYIHIPFCDVRCPYCHFYCFVNKDPELPMRYVQALRAELHRLREAGILAGGLTSIYFGGGTPSALAAPAREALCAWLADDLLPLCRPEAEITMEANPESATAENLSAWVHAGINRLSLGLQSMDEATLKFLGRLNTPASNRRALDLACSLVSRVSIDFIVGTPASRWEVVVAGLDEIFRWPVGHVSAYLLEIHGETRFGRDFASGRLLPQADEQQCAIYLALIEDLAARGLEAYELSNFARLGHRARHNSIYWRREPYLGLGASSHSFAQERRWWNHADARRYCAELEAGKTPTADCEVIDARARADEALLLGLRTLAGVPRESLGSKGTQVAALVRGGLAHSDPTQLRLTPPGWLLLDQIVAQLAQ